MSRTLAGRNPASDRTLEQGDWRATITRGERRLHPGRFVSRAKGLENCRGLASGWRAVATSSATCRNAARVTIGFGEIISRADAVKNSYRGLGIAFRMRGRAGSKTLAHQPTRSVFIVDIARFPTRVEHIFD